MPGFKAEVIADSSGKWATNGLVFATEEEAKMYGNDLWSRWTAVRDMRVVPTTDDPTYQIVDGVMSRIKE